jgi:hypothetical protein
MSKKRIISADGEEFYIDFSTDFIRVDQFCHLYRKKYINLYVFKIPYYSELSSINVGNVVNISHYSVDDIKNFSGKLIRKYRKRSTNTIEVGEWDGYLGSDESVKKRIMRDKKLNDLLKGNTSKLEDFLNNE